MVELIDVIRLLSVQLIRIEQTDGGGGGTLLFAKHRFEVAST
jgi:hypothetical protein